MSKIQHISLLQKCFGQVFVPQAVVQEVGFPLLSSPYLEVEEVDEVDETGQSFVTEEIGRLHRGELETLWLAKTLDADVVLLDDRRARMKAETLGLKPLGTLGVLVYAHKLGVLNLTEARQAVASLQTEADMYVSRHIVQQIDEQLERQDRDER